MSRLASSKPLDPEVVAHIGHAAERAPSPRYSPPGSPTHEDAIRSMVGAEGESVILYHASNEPVHGGLLERSEGLKRAVWVGNLERTVASEHAVRAVMRQAGHVAAVHLVKPSERSLNKKPWALVVFREELAAKRAVSYDTSPLPGGSTWRIDAVKPERLPGKQLTMVLDAWRQNKSPSRHRRASLDQLEADIVQNQQQREGLATAPTASAAREPKSPSRALVQDMALHPGAVGSRNSTAFFSSGEFDTPTKQRQPSFQNSGSPRNFFGIATPNSVHMTPRAPVAEQLSDTFRQYEQAGQSRDQELADQRENRGERSLVSKRDSTRRAIFSLESIESGSAEAEFEAAIKEDPKQLLRYRQPAAAMYRLAYRALNRLSALSTPSGLSAARAKPSVDSLQNCMATPSEKLRLAVETVCWLLKLPTDLPAMRKLVKSGELVEAMHDLDPSTLDVTATTNLRRSIAKLISDASVSADLRLEKVISQNERKPSPLHALCLWLYATHLLASPEDTWRKREGKMWSFVHLSLERRLVDPRLDSAVAWAKTTDLLRHVPDEQLREVMQHVDVVTAHPGQTVLRTGSLVNKITLVLAGTVTVFLTNVNAAAIARNNAALTLELWERQTKLGTLKRYRSALLFGSLGDAVQDKDGNVMHAHHEEWHRAVAAQITRTVGQQWQTKAKLKSARAAQATRVPLVLGAGATIGRDKAVAECKRMYETEHEDGDRAEAAKRQWPHAANTTIRCSTPAIMLEFSRPQDVLAIGLAQEKAIEEKFTELFRFAGGLSTRNPPSWRCLRSD
eukprot:COSAG02_NODE_3886_length_6086_cov_3.247211_4_plen_792_part_00